MGIGIDRGTTFPPSPRKNLQFTDCRRQGNTDGLKNLAAVAETLGADAELFPIILYSVSYVGKDGLVGTSKYLLFHLKQSHPSSTGQKYGL